jgi:hypothetical protein
MLLLLLEILFIGLTVFGLYWLKGHLGLAPLFVFVAACHFFNPIASTVSLAVFGRFTVFPGSGIIASACLLAILLVYLQEGLQATRRLIYSVVLATLALAILTIVTRWSLEAGRLQAPVEVSEFLTLLNIRLFTAGTALILVDVLLLFAAHEVLAARVPRLPSAARILVSLLLALSLAARGESR